MVVAKTSAKAALTSGQALTGVRLRYVTVQEQNVAADGIQADHAGLMT
jgi:hypothetical protein